MTGLSHIFAETRLLRRSMWRALACATLLLCPHSAAAARIEMADNYPSLRPVDIAIRAERAEPIRVHVLSRLFNDRITYSWQDFDLAPGLNRTAKLLPRAGITTVRSRWGLFWAQRNLDDPAAMPLQAELATLLERNTDIDVALEQDGRVLDRKLVRRDLPGESSVIGIDEAGLRGRLYRPNAVGMYPALLIIGGHPPSGMDAVGLEMADRGFVVLHIDYHSDFGGADCLAEVPVSYFVNALHWLRARSEVDGSRLGIYGISAGAEIVPWVVERFPDLRFAVLSAFSAWITNGGCGLFAASPWAVDGKPLPYAGNALFGIGLLPQRPDGTRTQSEQIRSYLWRGDRRNRYRIPIENLRIPTLLVGTGKDSLLPSKDSVLFLCGIVDCDHNSNIQTLIADESDHFIHHAPWLLYPCRLNEKAEPQAPGRCELTAAFAEAYFEALLRFMTLHTTN